MRKGHLECFGWRVEKEKRNKGAKIKRTNGFFQGESSLLAHCGITAHIRVSWAFPQVLKSILGTNLKFKGCFYHCTLSLFTFISK